MSSPRPAFGSVFGEVVAGGLVSISGLGQAISMAALVFVGPLANELPRAIASFTVAGAICVVLIGWRSQIVPVLTNIQDGPAVVMVAVAADFARSDPAIEPSQIFALIGASTLMVGVTSWLLGRFGLGNLVRFVPTTVVGAFVAGTGWLLIRGGISVMDNPDRADEASLLSSTGRIIPGVLLGTLVWAISRSKRLPPFGASLALVTSIGAFYAVVALQSSVAAVKAEGWLIGPFPTGAGIGFVTPANLADADWGSAVGSLPGVASVVAVSIIAILLNITGLEFMEDGRIDPDRELRVIGASNMIVAPLGATPSFHGLGDTTLAKRTGGRTRLVPIIAALTIAVFGLFGAGAIGLLPRMVVGAMLVAVGLALIVDWIIATARTTSRIDQLVGLGILLVIGLVGILPGIATGMVAVVVVFVVRYSRIDPVRLSGTGDRMRSRIDRSPRQVELLTSVQDRALFYRLHGYLFFGSVNRVELRVSEDLADRGPNAVDAVLLDLAQVHGIDASAYQLLASLIDSMIDSGVAVAVTGVDPSARHTLQQAGISPVVAWRQTLDDGFEFIEEHLLAIGSADTEDETGGSEVLARLSPELIALFDARDYPADSVIMEQGSASDEFYIVASGTLTAWSVDNDGTRHRLRRFGSGTIVGEMGMLTGRTRSAEVTTDTPTTLLLMSRAGYDRLRAEHPDLGYELHELIMTEQAQRVRTLSDALKRSLN